MRETIHAFIDTEEDGVVTNESMEIILVEDVDGNELERDGNEFRTIKRSAEKEINDVKCGETSVGVEIVSVGNDRV